ncbi:MAG: hypothetical protein JNK21_03475 [Rhodospirillaceae bacterium]|nr:hypothetical protein [Rhodospirillaceae bacterium]
MDRSFRLIGLALLLWIVGIADVRAACSGGNCDTSGECMAQCSSAADWYTQNAINHGAPHETYQCKTPGAGPPWAAPFTVSIEANVGYGPFWNGWHCSWPPPDCSGGGDTVFSFDAQEGMETMPANTCKDDCQYTFTGEGFCGGVGPGIPPSEGAGCTGVFSKNGNSCVTNPDDPVTDDPVDPNPEYESCDGAECVTTDGDEFCTDAGTCVDAPDGPDDPGDCDIGTQDAICASGSDEPPPAPADPPVPTDHGGPTINNFHFTNGGDSPNVEVHESDGPDWQSDSENDGNGDTPGDEPPCPSGEIRGDDGQCTGDGDGDGDGDGESGGTCPPGQERISGSCVNACPPGQTRGSNGACSSSVVCPLGQRPQGGVCVSNCPAGQTWNAATGQCNSVCPMGEFWNGTQCEEITDENECDPGEVRDDQGECGPGDGDGSVSGGGSCQSPPICTGDTVQCAVVQQTFETRCAVEALTDVTGADESLGTDYTPDQLFETVTIDDVPTIDSAGWLGGARSCPFEGGFVLSLTGGTVDVDLSMLCDLLAIGAQLVLLLAAIQCMRILGSG